MKLLIILISLFILSCAPQEQTTNNKSSTLYLPPNSLVEENIKNTDITILFKVIENNIVKLNKFDFYSGYEEKVKILKIYVGHKFIKKDIINYSGVGETKILGNYLKNRIGKKYIASLKKDKDNFINPDNGYIFEYSEELDNNVKLIIINLTKRSSGS